tara:strand:+ start:430 stop:1644 length:1215 start_codon:yes stop_codon:yes gene_type:complete
MAIDILGMQGLPVGANPYLPRVLPRRRPSQAAMSGFTPIPMPPGAATAMQGRPMNAPAPTMAVPTPTVMPQPRPATMAMPTVMPKPRPQMQGPQPATQLAPQGGLLGNLLASDLGSAKGRGIMSAAASLLESGGPVVGAPAPSIGQSLGRAYTAGMGAFDAQKAAEDALKSQAITDRYKTAQAAQMERSASQPILQDLGNGAFTRVTDPVTGESKIIENTDVKNYLEEQAIKKQTKNINLSDKQIEAQTEELDNIASNNDLLSQTDGFLDLIDDGKLEFGVVDAMGDSLALTTGLGDTEEAMNSQAFTRYINRLRNELLRMAKGVQTEGDAQRVIDELVTGVESRNTESVKNALVDLRKFQNQTIKRLRSKVQNRRKEKGLSEYDFGAGATADGVGYSVVEDDD